MLLSYNGHNAIQHSLRGSRIDFNSVDGEKILLPYDCAELLTDAQAIIFELVAKHDPTHAIYYTAAELPEMLESVQFYIGLNVQPVTQQERFLRGISDASPCRLNLYADIETKWKAKRRYQIKTDCTQTEADTVALLYQVDGRQGLNTEPRAAIGEWIRAWLTGRNKATA
jgi:hypothetical protein